MQGRRREIGEILPCQQMTRRGNASPLRLLSSPFNLYFFPWFFTFFPFSEFQIGKRDADLFSIFCERREASLGIISEFLGIWIILILAKWNAIFQLHFELLCHCRAFVACTSKREKNGKKISRSNSKPHHYASFLLKSPLFWHKKIVEKVDFPRKE